MHSTLRGALRHERQSIYSDVSLSRTYCISICFPNDSCRECMGLWQFVSITYEAEILEKRK